MDTLTLQQKFDSLPRKVRELILYNAGLSSAGIVGTIDVRLAPERIILELLRQIAVSTEELSGFLSEFNLGWELGELPSRVDISLAFPGEWTAMPITHVTAASIILWEVSMRVAWVLSDLPVDAGSLEPPAVNSVLPGTVSVSLGGSSLLVSGVGFVIASYGRLLPQATDQMYYGGALLTAVGLVDVAINWSKTIKEGNKLDSETQLNLLTVRQAQEKERAEKTSPPLAAQLVAPEDLKFEADRYGVPEPLAVHLLNEVMPALSDLNIAAGRPSIKVSPESPPRTQSARV